VSQCHRALLSMLLSQTNSLLVFNTSSFGKMMTLVLSSSKLWLATDIVNFCEDGAGTSSRCLGRSFSPSLSSEELDSKAEVTTLLRRRPRPLSGLPPGPGVEPSCWSSFCATSFAQIVSFVKIGLLSVNVT